MIEEKKNQKYKYLMLMLSAITVLVLVIVWQLFAPFQLDNDNIYLKTIASGEMTGVPEAHLNHMTILSGLILKLLYTVTGNGVPWFGILLCASIAVTMVLMMYKTLSVSDRIWKKAVLFVVFLISFVSFFYQYFAMTQYTLTTGIIGAGSLFLFAATDYKKVGNKEFILNLLPFVLLSAWAAGMRQKAFFMLFPFFGIVFLGLLLDALKSKDKTFLKRTVIVFSLFIATNIAVFLLDFAAYSKEEWKDYRQYNSDRESIVDYSGFPLYEENKSAYANLGISKSSYEALTKHYNLILDENINANSMEALSEISKNNKKDEKLSFVSKTVGVIKGIVNINLFEYQDRPINIPVYLLYLFVFALSLFLKRYKALRDLGFLIGARMVDWVYLVWIGRYPFRVTQIIYIAEALLLIAIILRYELWQNPVRKKNKEKKNIFEKAGFNFVFAIMLLMIAAAGIRFGIPVMKNNYNTIKGSRAMSTCFVELEDYLSAHPDNFYFFDMSHLYYTEDTLSFEKKPYENYVYMGSWMPNSPWYNNKMKAWGFETPTEGLLEKDNVYIIYQQVDFDTRDFLDYYFEEHFPGTKIEVVDTFVSSNGFVYEILKPR